MKRLLLGAGAVALIAGLYAAPNALADEPSARCDGGVVSTPSPGTSGTQNVCVPGVGGVEASGDAEAGSGYVVADGDSTGAGPLDGYIGVEGDATAGPTVVGSCSGDYDPATGGAPIEPGGDTTDCQP